MVTHMPISDETKRSLKSQSHHLKPIILLGANGLTDSVHTEIARALYDHELIKIKLNSKDKSEKQQLSEAICTHHNATLVNQIGHIIVIYKASDKHKK